MGLEKCPRCELNYIRDGEKYCAVCRREMRGEEERMEEEVCSACGERRPVPGEELCVFCLREIRRQEGRVAQSEKTEDAPLNPMAVTDMDEIELEEEEDEIPSTELGEIDRELGGDDEEEDSDVPASLEQLEEEELNQADEDEEDL